MGLTESFTKHDMPKILALVGGFFTSCDDEKTYTLEIKEKRKRRSLDSNSYFWTLCDRLAEATGLPKTEIYRSYIREIGGNSDILCIQDTAVDHFCEIWEHGHIGRFADKMPSKLQGCTNVVVYYGSSDYDTATMSRLIDMVVQDCEEHGIETLTPDEIAALNAAWGGEADA